MTFNKDKLDKIVADAHRNRAERDKSYRERALKLYPWICGRCSREFDLGNLRELTVHHKDHDHFNNPSDGSNWELLCVYCHDHEHQIHADAIAAAEAGHMLEEKKHKEATHNPFAGLKDMLGKKDE